MPSNILFIEDDPNIRGSLRTVLEREGHSILEAESGESGLDLFARQPADVVLVDILLPGIDGFEVARRLRRSSDVPIVMVTALTDTHDVVAGLEAGADDYVTKPVEAKELSARIRALLRRAAVSANGPEVLRFGDLEVQPDAGTVKISGEEVRLTRTEFRLLCEFATNPGWVLSRTHLLEKVWDYDYFGDSRLVDVHVRRLRSKIEKDSTAPRLIVTVRGLGYKLQP